MNYDRSEFCDLKFLSRVDYRAQCKTQEGQVDVILQPKHQQTEANDLKKTLKICIFSFSFPLPYLEGSRKSLREIQLDFLSKICHGNSRRIVAFFLSALQDLCKLTRHSPISQWCSPFLMVKSNCFVFIQTFTVDK